MDTRLKKSSKLSKIVIILCVMLPAIFLVSLYPRMEKAMLEKRESYLELEKEQEENAPEWVMEENFVNYAMESSYYLYANLIEIAEKRGVYDGVFQQYGWDSDFFYAVENMTYIATYTPESAKEPYVKKNAETLDTKVAKLVLEFDAYGKLMIADLQGNIEIDGENKTVFQIAERSTSQFKENVSQYEKNYGKEIDENEYIPKNFKIEIGLNEHSNFVWNYDEYYGIHGWYDKSPENLYWVIGAYWIVPILVVIVVLTAWLLPFIKKLNTGRERLFSMPFEIMVGIAAGTVALGVGLCFLMPYMTMFEVKNNFEDNLPRFVGLEINLKTIYHALLIINTIAWTLEFFLVYIVSSNIRQIISKPVYYFKNQILFVRMLGWIKTKFFKLYNYVTRIEINEKINSCILKIVIANFVILSMLCCMWFFGVAGLIVYSIVLYVILRKEGAKIRRQYQSILHATRKIAEGKHDVKLEDDLGVFEPIGQSLVKVKEGMEKAIMEEAKSQNMRTELITNVSHDLKTPLTAIITYVDLLKQENITEEERQSYIDTLEQKSQRLKVLIEDLFEVSKANSGNVNVNLMEVDVVSLLKQVRSEMDEQIKNSNLQFRFNFPEEKQILYLDGQKMYRIFENLFNNVLKYAMPNTRVYIDLYSNEEEVTIQFRNVSALELDYTPERLMERFVRGDSSRNSEGNGLGLAIVKSFVELQKGQFSIEIEGDIFKTMIVLKKHVKS